MTQCLLKIAKINLDFTKERDEARNLAIEATNKIKKYNKMYYDERHTKPTIYKEGDFVLIKDSVLKPGEDSKLKPKYKGPFLIAKVLNKNRYVVQGIPGHNVTQRAYNSILSSDRIKPWIKPVVNTT